MKARNRVRGKVQLTSRPKRGFGKQSPRNTSTKKSSKKKLWIAVQQTQKAGEGDRQQSAPAKGKNSPLDETSLPTTLPKTRQPEDSAYEKIPKTPKWRQGEWPHKCGKLLSATGRVQGTFQSHDPPTGISPSKKKKLNKSGRKRRGDGPKKKKLRSKKQGIVRESGLAREGLQPGTKPGVAKTGPQQASSLWWEK